MAMVVVKVIVVDIVVDTVATKVDTLEEVVVFNVASRVTLLGIVSEVNGLAAEVVDTQMVVVVVVMVTLC
ncbi:hypothetical protein EJD97_004110 [Solanum chilense]|uniref:Uncharacterized protein n=1 Tax=Solanum chilense TaxID=4083 RepID=A0A6N2AK28_SOLCI|nr:hypothetical protein EJD97_004110 [Solanum chilense]